MPRRDIRNNYALIQNLRTQRPGPEQGHADQGPPQGPQDPSLLAGDLVKTPAFDPIFLLEVEATGRLVRRHIYDMHAFNHHFRGQMGRVKLVSFEVVNAFPGGITIYGP